MSGPVEVEIEMRTWTFQIPHLLAFALVRGAWWRGKCWTFLAASRWGARSWSWS